MKPRQKESGSVATVDHFVKCGMSFESYNLLGVDLKTKIQFNENESVKQCQSNLLSKSNFILTEKDWIKTFNSFRH